MWRRCTGLCTGSCMRHPCPNNRCERNVINSGARDDRRRVESLEPTAVGTGLPSIDKVVRVDDLLYTQRECSDRFSDGREFQDLITALDSWQIDPTHMDFLSVDAFGKRCPATGVYAIRSLENRRLYCLKQHQENVSTWIVHVRVRCKLLPDDPTLLRYMERASTTGHIRINWTSSSMMAESQRGRSI